LGGGTEGGLSVDRVRRLELEPTAGGFIVSEADLN